MDWNENLKTYVSRPENSLSFLYNFHHDQHPGLEMKHLVAAQTPQMAVPAMDNHNYYGNHHEKKKRLTNDQLESLESSFEEEMKLDPDRKMKLAHELQLQPRQVAVWFQNRRARWKAKQLECLYDKLKLEFDAVSREKQKLQEEVLALKAMVKEQGTRKPVSTGYTDMSGEETVESTSVANRSSGKQPRVISHHQITECNYVFTGDDFTPVVMPPYWGTVLPSYPEI